MTKIEKQAKSKWTCTSVYCHTAAIAFLTDLQTTTTYKKPRSFHAR